MFYKNGQKANAFSFPQKTGRVVKTFENWTYFTTRPVYCKNWTNSKYKHWSQWIYDLVQRLANHLVIGKNGISLLFSPVNDTICDNPQAFSKLRFLKIDLNS
jgi:hypothetical protein